MHFLKHKDVSIIVPSDITSSAFSGEYKLVARRVDNGKITYESPWRKNVITNYGLTYMGNNYWNGYCAVGTGNTPPAVTDTQLTSLLAIASWGSGSGAPNFTYSSDLTYPGLKTTITMAARFDETVIGVIRELGIARTSNIDWQYNDLITHALVSPEYNKTAAEILDVYYRITRYWDNLHDLNGTGQVVLDGLTYDYLLKGYHCESPISNGYWAPTQDQSMYFRHYASTGPSVEPKSTDLVYNADGQIASPTYTESSYEANLSRSGDTAWIDRVFTTELNYQNNTSALPKGIRSLWCPLNSSSYPGWQCQFTDTLNGWPIQKDRTKRMYFTFRVSWTRL
jgi:hypothetical protein